MKRDAFWALVAMLIALILVAPLWALVKVLPLLAEAILVHARVILLALEASQPTSYL